MDTSNAQQHQQETLESILVRTKPHDDQKKPRPQPDHIEKCPRCNSLNTKFCYYNNYSLSQPRYYCKGCKRYWTKGGTLRNIPSGGNCRKNKRPMPKSRNGLNQTASSQSSPLSGLVYDVSSDINLAFARLQKQTMGEIGFNGQELSMMGNSSNAVNGLFSNFAEVQSGYHNHNQNMYYGIGGWGNGLENGGIGMNYGQYEDMGMVAYEPEYNMKEIGNVKEEYLCGREEEQRVLWGYPWQIGGIENIAGEFENTGRESWNGIGGTWHGLLKSPLM